jgi:hypothetical protein
MKEKKKAKIPTHPKMGEGKMCLPLACFLSLYFWIYMVRSDSEMRIRWLNGLGQAVLRGSKIKGVCISGDYYSFDNQPEASFLC